MVAGLLLGAQMARLLLAGFIVGLVIVQCGCVAHEYLESPDGGVVEAALDGQSCGLLADRLTFGFSTDASAEYRRALKEGRIVKIKSHTAIRGVSELFYERGRFVEIYPTLAGDDLRARHIAVVNWVVPKEGSYEGKTVCVVDGIKFDAPPPL
jgi:hypothetical protein